MSDFKVFEGKTIDDAISLACEHFDSDREQLEIEIVSDSKGGIFGLVGARKAQVKAKKRNSSAELEALVMKVVERIVSTIIPSPAITVEAEDASRVKVNIQDDEDSGLLIGREGQTLAAVQYLANRIIANLWKEPVKIQIDTGDYRERQDENLRQLAQHLADRAKDAGRPQSTKPLSSYHRRLVHLALQDDETVTTRSKGDGPLKRVLILPKREQKGRGRQNQSNRGGGRSRNGRKNAAGATGNASGGQE